MKITIEYGTGNEYSQEFPEGVTAQDVATHPWVQAELGFGWGVDLVNASTGAFLPRKAPLSDGDYLWVYDRPSPMA